VFGAPPFAAAAARRLGLAPLPQVRGQGYTKGSKWNVFAPPGGSPAPSGPASLPTTRPAAATTVWP